MKNIFIVSMFLAVAVQADIIKCHFTEPMVTTTYNTSKATLTYQDSNNKKTVVKNVSFQIRSAGVFELVSQNGKLVQTINLNSQGSDGMSDRLYPYSVKDSKEITQQGLGGCESNYLK